MAPTYPDFVRKPMPYDVPPYANAINCYPLYRGEVPVPFTFPTGLKMRLRVSAHRVDNEYIENYSRAVQLMKELPVDDPRSFIQQANVHLAYCNGAYYMGNSEKTLSVHCGWFFLPWHRWYLYFYERILAKLLGDDTFALPFWNWDYKEGMTIPPMYLDEKSYLFDGNRNPEHTSDTTVDLGYDGTDRFRSNEEQVDANYKVMHKSVVCSKSAEAFHGGKITEDTSECKCRAGSLELSPHNTIHNWTGRISDRKKCFGEDMGTFYSSALDPIFFAHHANVDRVWTLWKELCGGKDYGDPDLLDTRFFFYDENKKLVSVRAGDAYDAARLCYSYDDCPTPWVCRREYDNIQPQLGVAAHLVQTRSSQNYIAFTTALGANLVPTWSSQNDIAFMKAVGANLVQTWSSQNDIAFKKPVKIKVTRQRQSQSEDEEEVLMIESIRAQRDIAVKFDVFVNLDPWLVTHPYVDTVPREYAGTFISLARGARGGAENGCGKSSLGLEISKVLSDLNVGKEQQTIDVILIPKVQLEEDIRISAVKLGSWTSLV